MLKLKHEIRRRAMFIGVSPHWENGDGALCFPFVGWTIWGACASRVQVRASRPNPRWTNQLVDGFSARRRKRQPGRLRSLFRMRMGHGLFSRIHLGMDKRHKNG